MIRHCLIVIDMQNDFLEILEEGRRLDLISRTNQLIEIFRGSGFPVVWVTTSFRPDLSDAFLEMRDRQISVVIDGTVGAEIHSDLERSKEDAVILKKRYSAFFGTDLEQLLSDVGADKVTLAGVNTHACVRTTAIDAYQRDWRVVLASECIDSYDTAHARLSMAYMNNKIAVALMNDEISDRMK